MKPRLRVYCETLPYEEVMRRRTVELLRRYHLSLVLAVRPWHLAERVLPRVAGALAEAEVPLAVWPMLADEEGRWASSANAASFARLVLGCADALAEARVPFEEMLFDLEPPFAQARALATGLASDPRELADVASGGARLRARAKKALDAAESELARAAAELHARGIATSAAVWPLVALDPPGVAAWQRLLGTPLDAVGIERVSVMVYTSILEGWSRGALRRRHAQSLLAAACRRTAGRWGSRGGVSLGCVGTGAFEDEPVYRSPRELAEDVAVARAEGCTDLSLFDLGGVLARAPAEAWLDAFASGEAASADLVAPSRRVAAARTLARAATWALARRR